MQLDNPLSWLNNPYFIVGIIGFALAMSLRINGIIYTVFSTIRSAWKIVAIWALVDYATAWFWQPFGSYDPILAANHAGNNDVVLQRLAIAGALMLLFGNIAILAKPINLRAGLQTFVKLPAQRRREMNARSTISAQTFEKSTGNGGPTKEEIRQQMANKPNAVELTGARYNDDGSPNWSSIAIVSPNG